MPTKSKKESRMQVTIEQGKYGRFCSFKCCHCNYFNMLDIEGNVRGNYNATCGYCQKTIPVTFV